VGVNRGGGGGGDVGGSLLRFVGYLPGAVK
jgi:hypothetical protein